MTLTTEEKRAIDRREVEGRIRGLVQKCLNSMMDAKALKKEMEKYTGDRQEEGQEDIERPPDRTG